MSNSHDAVDLISGVFVLEKGETCRRQLPTIAKAGRSDQAIQLHRGTWHENPIPPHDGQVVVVSSHAALTRGHQSVSAQQKLEAFKQDVEKRNITEIGGFALQIAVPTEVV